MVIIKPVNGLFNEAVDYRYYVLNTNSTWYNNDMAEKLNKMTKRTAMQMKDQTSVERIPCL